MSDDTTRTAEVAERVRRLWAGLEEALTPMREWYMNGVLNLTLGSLTWSDEQMSQFGDATAKKLRLAREAIDRALACEPPSREG
jgi:hypothetical protein